MAREGQNFRNRHLEMLMQLSTVSCRQRFPVWQDYGVPWSRMICDTCQMDRLARLAMSR
ncbi:hypothetical protein GCM10017784_39360 [Deinococcus indicus]|nr:hypothetical protein GCM10017784_39360 [Deinococcus indicus]